MATIEIIVGSVTGNAVDVAQATAKHLRGLGHSCTLSSAYRGEDLNAQPKSILLICTSTTGAGDLPANILPFYLHLTSAFPSIAGRYYNVITLGDSSYPTFAEAGKTMDAALADLGAVRLGEPLVIDAILSDSYTEDAIAWAQEWSTLLAERNDD